MSFTGRFLLLAALVALGAAVGVWAGGALAQAWLIPALILVAALWLEQTLTRAYKLTLRRDVPASVELGRDLSIHYHLHATPARALALDLAEAMPEALAGGDWQSLHHIPAHGALEFSQRRQTQELAELTFERVKARVLGVFGLCWWTRELTAPARVRVVPQSLTQAERRQFTREYGESAQRKSGQGLELLTLRDYQLGDPPRSIDWKASARALSHVDTTLQDGQAPNNGRSYTDALKVRVMSQDQNLELTIMLDVGRRARLAVGTMRKFDHAINLASRLAQASLSAGDTLHLIAYADAPIAQAYNLRGTAGIRRLHHLLASLTQRPEESDPHLAAGVLLRRLPRRTLLVCFSDTDSPPALEKLLRAQALLARKHLTLVACLQDPELAALAAAPHGGQTEWRAPAQLLAAQELLSTERRARERLSAQGAVVVSAFPEHIDAAVLGAYVGLRKRRAV
jgi:uncharacterized protein (DUF58 family)